MDLIIGLVSIGIALWISITILKFIFMASKKFIGWIGPYIVAGVPSIAMYAITTDLFGYGTSSATLTGLASAIVIGSVLNSV